MTIGFAYSGWRIWQCQQLSDLSPDSIKLAQISISENFGKIDILVNCAAISRRWDPIWEVSEEDWNAIIANNLKGTFNTCCHACVSMVKQNSGRIIDFSSPAWLGVIIVIAGYLPPPL